MPLSTQRPEARLFTGEEERIRMVYAGRIPEPSYAESAVGRFQMQERERQVLQVLQDHLFLPLRGKRILELGCGSGQWLRDLVGWGAEPETVVGVDLLPGSVARAQRTCAPGVRIECGNGASLRFDTAGFDLVLQSTAFSSVLDDEMRRAMAGEMLRVVRPGGILLWYDLAVRNPWNPDVKPIRPVEIGRLFPGCALDLRRISLAPPLARLVAPHSFLLGYLLARVAPLCTHYLGVIRKPGVQP